MRERNHGYPEEYADMRVRQSTGMRFLAQWMTLLKHLTCKCGEAADVVQTLGGITTMSCRMCADWDRTLRRGRLLMSRK